jgi:hypothetical protein
MRTNLLRLSLGSLAVIACCSLPLSRADEDEDELKLKKATEAARVAVLRLADGYGEDPTKPVRDMNKEAAALAKEHSLEATHKLLKPKNKGGIGIGRLIGAGHKDSIELLIRDYAIKGPTRTEVLDYGDEIIKAGRITLAIAEMTPHWAPRDEKMMAKWQAQSAEMRQTALDFVVAAQSRDHEKIATTAKRLNESCAACHKMIRYER